jgi:putative heme-binding domain-containing protein
MVFLQGAVVLWCVAAAAQDHAGQYSQADIERGSRLYGANCAFCHGANGNAISNVDLRSGKFRKAASDEDLARLITTGVPGTAMPPHKFQDAELTGIVAYIRSMRDSHAATVAVGDARRGREIFAGKGACMSCHRVNGQGSRMAPDLSDIGTVRSARALEESLLDPTSSMLPMNRSVRGVTRDGKVVTGRRLNEDTFSVQLIDADEHLVSLAKADLKEYTVIKTSAMPSYRTKLSTAELGDLVAYLLTLDGVN